MNEGEQGTAPSPQRGSVQVRADIYRGQRIRQVRGGVAAHDGRHGGTVPRLYGRSGRVSQACAVIKRILPDIRSQEEFVKMFLDEAHLIGRVQPPEHRAGVRPRGEDGGWPLPRHGRFIPGQNLRTKSLLLASSGATPPLPVELFVHGGARRSAWRCNTRTLSRTPPANRFPIVHRDVAQKKRDGHLRGDDQVIGLSALPRRGRSLAGHTSAW